MKTLVVGCDASGKSTFLESVQKNYGDTVGESSRSEEAQRFKHANLSTPIDPEYISARESLYLGLSKHALLNMEMNRDEGIVTTDSSLVTRLSHNVMRRVISNESALSDEDIITEWQRDEEEVGIETPDIVVFTHAPFAVIRNRIVGRQNDGDKSEVFWGFNAPFFLESYQDSWHKIMLNLSKTAQVCMSVDTSEQSKDECLDAYDQLRQSIEARRTS